MTLPDRTTAGKVVGVVLAAGLSRRLGRPKQLVVLAGRALIWHSVRAMLDAEHSGGVLVVIPPGELGQQVRAALHGLDVMFAENPRPELGISESFRAAIAALPAGTGAVNFALGDMPLVSGAMQRVVLDAYTATGAPLVLARFGPQNTGLQDTGPGNTDWVRAPPHLFRADLFPEFSQRGDHGPRHVIAAHAGQTVWVDLPASALRDLDTLEDISAMQREFAGRGRK